MTKEEELMSFLHEKVFDPILNSKEASAKIKSGVNRENVNFLFSSADILPFCPLLHPKQEFDTLQAGRTAR